MYHGKGVDVEIAEEGAQEEPRGWRVEYMPVHHRVISTAKQGFYSANPFKTDQVSFTDVEMRPLPL